MTTFDISVPHHALRAMSGRDPEEPHRASTPLELLYDLTIVVAFGIAGSQFAHLIEERHFWPGLAGFGFAMFAVCWAWMNYTWFASAYDTDDWFFRLATLTQMVGVLVLALGLPDLFHGLDDGWQFHNQAMVAGYVVMRVAMIALWLRAAAGDPARRRTCLTYVSTISLAQAGWVLLALFEPPTYGWVAAFVVLFLVEFSGPVLAETRKVATPWHPHHIAERFGLLAIIAFGEGIIGTSASLEALIGTVGWTPEVAVLGVAGVGLTFGMWWIYFVLPAGALLAVRRDRAFGWAYSHLLVYAMIAAVGAGLHVAASYLDGRGELSETGVIAATAVPVAGYLLAAFWLFHYFVPGRDPFHLGLGAITLLVLAASVWMAASGVSLGLCLLVLMLAPWVTVLGYESVGHRHVRDRLALT